MINYAYFNAYEKNFIPYAFKSVAEARAAHCPKHNDVYLGVVKLPLEYTYVR